jgi:hypothetical protein
VTKSLYAAAGVDLSAADDAKARIGKLVASTRTALSVGEVGSFGGMLRVPGGMQKPVPMTATRLGQPRAATSAVGLWFITNRSGASNRNRLRQAIAVPSMRFCSENPAEYRTSVYEQGSRTLRNGFGITGDW